MKIICPEELKNLLYVENDRNLPHWVVKKFKKQYDLIESCEDSTELYKYSTLRVHKLTGDLEWFLGVDLIGGRRIEIKILKDEVIEIVKMYRISNHYKK
jgi:plasmid maintenance system killer protein